MVTKKPPFQEGGRRRFQLPGHAKRGWEGGETLGLFGVFQSFLVPVFIVPVGGEEFPPALSPNKLAAYCTGVWIWNKKRQKPEPIQSH
jgi:hypothetical protein